MAENGRFSKGPNGHFACSEATALDRNPAVCQTLRLLSPAASSGHRPRELAVGGHFSRTWAWTHDLCER